MSESAKDIANIEAWAEIIEDLLYRVPSDSRAAVLELAAKNEAAERENRSGAFRVFSPKEMAEWKKSPGFRHRNAIMRLKSVVIQTFARDITNDHSPKEAARLLFAQHKYGTGSGCLADYIDDLPRASQS